LRAGVGATVSVAHADDDHDDERGGKYSETRSSKYGGENRGKSLQPAQANAKFQQECTSCHIAYAPGLLPPNPGANSWPGWTTLRLGRVSGCTGQQGDHRLSGEQRLQPLERADCALAHH